MAYLGRSIHHGTSWGLVGGIVGTVAYCLLSYLLPVNGQPAFVELFIAYGVGSATAIGWGVDLVVGLAIGAIFAYVVNYYEKVEVSTYPRGLVLGGLAGLLVWAWLYLPVVNGFLPFVATSYSWVIAGSAGSLVVFGVIMGAITAFGTRRILKRGRASEERTQKPVVVVAPATTS